jgi:alkylation response protein AidB-like acyl-CoA dehydrogenase
MSEASSDRTTYADIDAADLALLGDSIAEVLAEEAGSLAIHAYIDGNSPLDRLLWRRAVELGWCAIALPERFGGLDFGPRALDVLFQKLGAHAAPGPFLATLCAAQALIETADEALLVEWIPRVAAGECRIAIPAQFNPDGQGRDGPLMFLGDADSELFLAPVGAGGWALLRFDAALVERLDMWDRTRSVVRADPAKAERVAEIAEGAVFAQRLSLHVALALASDSLGASRALLAQTMGFMKERRQFDRPIASFQALKHRVADMMTMIVAGDPVIEQALSALVPDSVDAGMWTAHAKAKLVEDFASIAQDCLQLHGGVGFTWEYDVHVFLKRARLSEMLLAPGWTLRDRAAEGLAAAAREQRSTLELPLI